MQPVSSGYATSPQSVSDGHAPFLPALGAGLTDHTDQKAQSVDVEQIEHQLTNLSDPGNREKVIAAVRQILINEVDLRVQEKADQLWHKGKQILSSSQIKHKEKNQSLVEELADCQKRHQALEAESEKLKQVLTGLASHFSTLGAVFGEPDNGAGMRAGTPDVDMTMSPNHDVCPDLFSPGVFTAATETVSALDTAASQPFAEIPDFNFASQCVSSATPLSLSETIAGPQNPQPLSLANSLSPPSSVGAADCMWTPGHSDASTYTFSFTLHKADGADLGLNVSHREFDRVLRVEGVRANGAVEAWNLQCVGGSMADQALLPGDTIISVNQILHEPKKMLEECRDKQSLTFTVVRNLSLGAPTVAPPNALSTLRAEASEFVPFSAAAVTSADDPE